MSCERMTQERLRQELRGALPESERRLVRAHLAQPCEACLDLLASTDGDALIAALAGPEAELSREESERMFEAAAPRASVDAARPMRASRTAAQKGRVIPLRRRAWLGIGSAVAVAASIALVVVRSEPRGLKGNGSLSPPELILLAGVATPTPHVVRALGAADRLDPNELVLLRARLDEPAQLYLFSVDGAGKGELLFAAAEPAGERELSEHGEAVALDPRALGDLPQLVLAACAQPLAEPTLAAASRCATTTRSVLLPLRENTP